jgi:predicted transcriptional regulator
MDSLTPTGTEDSERDRADCVAAVEEGFADIGAGRTYLLEEEMARWQQMKIDMLAKSKSGADREESVSAELPTLEDADTLDAETIAAIEEGLAEAEAGKDRPFEEYVQEMNAFWESRRNQSSKE